MRSRHAVEPTGQVTLFSPQLHVTRPARRHRRGGALTERVREALRHFPELDGQRVTLGVTRVADGIAVFEDMTVRFDLRRGVPSFYTIGHELTHLLQALRCVPGGEVQCDIWTLARGRLFHDEPPCYLPLPTSLRRGWRRHSAGVGYLCRRAINERATRRYYIRWLDRQLREIGERARPRKLDGRRRGVASGPGQ